GYVYATRAALRRMLPRDHGTIVQVGSAVAYRGIPLQTAYSGAKHALQGWHEALRCELLHAGTHVRTTMVQLPAVNTPQFDWVLNRTTRSPRPLRPIHQPEFAARAIVHAADHPARREYWVGASTAATLMLNAVAPGLLDRYLARTGFAGQETDEPLRDWRANLWRPVDAHEDRGAHGRFDKDAATDNRHYGAADAVQGWISRHHTALAASAAAAAASAGAIARSRR
ncbi:MAG: SDR family NAD(P)-dependent oxidoreductase, partial [Streptomycetaceae bacterium]|nr:SDR family NAD(P)-dependent oxidoreductase [Streptomycetaceae bacterium]